MIWRLQLETFVSKMAIKWGETKQSIMPAICRSQQVVFSAPTFKSWVASKCWRSSKCCTLLERSEGSTWPGSGCGRSVFWVGVCEGRYAMLSLCWLVETTEQYPLPRRAGWECVPGIPSWSVVKSASPGFCTKRAGLFPPLVTFGRHLLIPLRSCKWELRESNLMYNNVYN